jgi:predicted NodU family carbamoyl transferase
MFGCELIVAVFIKILYICSFRPSMTVVIGFDWPVEHDHTGVMGGGEFLFASEEERWTRHRHSPVLNTSFNLAGEPPVKTPLDAIKSLAPGRLRQLPIRMAIQKNL